MQQHDLKISVRLYKMVGLLAINVVSLVYIFDLYISVHICTLAYPLGMVWPLCVHREQNENRIFGYSFVVALNPTDNNGGGGREGGGGWYSKWNGGE